MHLKKYIQLQIFFQNVDLVKIYQENHEDKVLPSLPPCLLSLSYY